MEGDKISRSGQRESDGDKINREGQRQSEEEDGIGRKGKGQSQEIHTAKGDRKQGRETGRVESQAEQRQAQ